MDYKTTGTSDGDAYPRNVVAEQRTSQGPFPRKSMDEERKPAIEEGRKANASMSFTAPRVRVNAKQNAKGAWQLDITAETVDGSDPVGLLLATIKSAEEQLTADGRTLAQPPAVST